MLPPTSPHGYHSPQSMGQYCFDLKVNVDFNSGKVNLGVPQNIQPFGKKQEIPVVYGSQGSSQLLHSNHSFVNTSQLGGPPSQQYAPFPQNMQNYVRNDQIYNSAYSPNPQQHEDLTRYGNMKARSANETYPDTFGSFSYNLQRSVDAVNCVICDRPVNRQQFHAHLEQHKARRKQYNRIDPHSRGNSFQVRNEHSMAGVVDMYKQPSRQSRNNNSRNSQSLPHRQLGGFRKQPNNSLSFSRQLEQSQSRIVYAPRDPSRLLSPQHSRAALDYSKSSGYESHPSRNNFSGRPKQPSSNHQSLSMQNLSKNLNYPSNYADPSINQSNRINSYNVLPQEISRQQVADSYRTKQPQTRENNLFQSTRARPLNIRQNKSQVRPDYYNLNLTESQIVQPNPASQRYSLQDCDQSMINHLTQISRFSKQSSIGEIKKQLKIQQIQQEDSSDQEELYYSLRPSSFERRAYTSVNPAQIKKRIDESRYTSNGLTRSKMPINNLAVEEFIQNPMYYSCYRSTHRM